MSLTTLLRACRVWAAALALIGVAIAFFPLPYPTTVTDRGDALVIALDALLQGKTVATPQGLEPLEERQFVTRSVDHLYFINTTGAPDSIFVRRGLKPIPSGKVLGVDRGDVVVRASYDGLDGKRTWHMQFSYVFGSLGGIGYEIRIYKSLAQRRIVFVHTWTA